MGDKLRIYVGGLGSSVGEIDLKKTFTSPQLGDVQSVEIIRTKGRSFAYLEFVPASEKGLAKLFSTYNGCLWKGGRLKLEKAKEDYLARLRHEWEEDAQIEVDLFCQNIKEDESMHAAQKPQKDYDNDKLQLNIFFPKLRKIKPIPLKGSGKHKYSFQRVEVPPLPTHFCDCDEHSGPPDPPKTNFINNDESNNINNDEMDNYGVNENELNMMKSILSKFLEKEDRTETVTTGEVTEKKNNDASLADNVQVDDSEEDQVSDEDNLMINIVGTKSKRIASFEDWEQKTAIADQNSLVREPGSFSNPTSETHGPEKGKHTLQQKKKQSIPKDKSNEKGKHTLQKKRKQSIPEDKSNDKVPPKKKGKKWNQDDTIDDLVVEKTQPTDRKSGSIQLIGDAKKSNKSAWKALISEKGSTVFNVSDIVTTLNKSEGENKPISDENDGQKDQSSQYEEPEKIYDDQTTKKSASSQYKEPEKISDDQTTKKSASSQYKEPEKISDDQTTKKSASSQYKEPEKLSDDQTTKKSASVDNSGRGASWLKKSSWLQLVGDANSSAFSIAHILPEATLEKLESQQSHELRSVEVEQQRDQKSPVGEPQVGADTASPEFDVVKEKNDGAQLILNSDSNPSVDADVAPNYRAIGDIVISETCPFMKTNASMKEWIKSKAAVSESQKKNDKGKESR